MTVWEKLKIKTQFAYSPYSKIKVACLVTDAQRREGWGVNVENLSYGLTVCAEQAAIVNFISSWGPNSLTMVYLFSPQTNFLLPCGRCRQLLVEHQSIKTPIKLTTFNQQGDSKTYTLSELIPNEFQLN